MERAPESESESAVGPTGFNKPLTQTVLEVERGKGKPRDETLALATSYVCSREGELLLHALYVLVVAVS